MFSKCKQMTNKKWDHLSCKNTFKMYLNAIKILFAKNHYKIYYLNFSVENVFEYYSNIVVFIGTYLKS